MGGAVAWAICGGRHGELTCVGWLAAGTFAGNGGAEGIGVLYVASWTLEGCCSCCSCGGAIGWADCGCVGNGGADAIGAGDSAGCGAGSGNRNGSPSVGTDTVPSPGIATCWGCGCTCGCA